MKASVKLLETRVATELKKVEHIFTSFSLALRPHKKKFVLQSDFPPFLQSKQSSRLKLIKKLSNTLYSRYNCIIGYQHFIRILWHFNTWFGIVDRSQISNISVKYWSTTTHKPDEFTSYILLCSDFSRLVGCMYRDIRDLWSVYNTNSCIEVP